MCPEPEEEPPGLTLTTLHEKQMLRTPDRGRLSLYEEEDKDVNVC